MNDVVALVHKAIERPLIRLVEGELDDIADQAERALLDAGLPCYRRGDSLVRPVVDEVDASHGRRTPVAVLHVIDQVYLRAALARVCRFEKWDSRKGNWAPRNPPADIAATILSKYGEWRFPPVVGVLSTPTLRPDGTILSEPGYDPETRLLLVEPLTLPRLKDRPSRDDATEAVVFLESLLEEFPLVGQPSQSVALSALITPVVRAAFSVAPMHVARAPVASSGKSYLFDVASAIATGQLCPVIAAGRTEEETEKRIGSALISGQAIINIDNLNGELSGDALCQAIERPVVLIRVLGHSKQVRIEARSVMFFATGNNIVIAGDMSRRCLLATLDPRLERPELRRFTGDPVAEVLANRGRYIAAALTICRAYIAAGRPDPAPRLASFEGWSDTVRSALMWLDRADPVASMEVIRNEDPERAALREVLAAWADAFGTGRAKQLSAAKVVQKIGERDTRQAGDGDAHSGYTEDYRYPELRNAIVGAVFPDGRKPNANSLGKWLSARKGRIADGRCFNSYVDTHGHPATWWVETVMRPDKQCAV